MGKLFDESEVFINEELEFTLGDRDYFWVGSFEIHSFGESQDWDYVGDCETAISILSTHQLCTWDDEAGASVDVVLTREIYEAIVYEIERTRL